jgi:SAM-dependent methyltransferase
MHETRPTHRFSNRVADYIAYRPEYPDALIDYLRGTLGLTSAHVVADVGSGTGLLTRLLLENGNRVFAVEPNDEMRRAGEMLMAAFQRLTSVAGTAEATTLADASVDVVTAAQAFHWFDRDAARAEFRRILVPGGRVVLVWNQRRTGATPFMRDYERLLIERAVDYERVDHRRVGAADLDAFFDAHTTHRIAFDESLDFPSTLGRMLSASYVPAPGHPLHDAIVAGLCGVFERHEHGGHVPWNYDTVIHSGVV